MMSRRRTRRLAGVGIALLLLAAVSIGWIYMSADHVEAAELPDGTKIKFRTQDDRFEIYEDGRWEPFFAQGVNLGASMPGYYPGSLPIDKDTYLRWFDMMTEMGSNVVRIYTIHPPHFYEALVEYNRKNKDRPLYLIQGVWSPEEQLIEKRDAFDPEIVEMFKQEIIQTVGAVYGDITIEPSPGKASGEFTANAGPYLMAWQVGTEWDPQMVVDTNEKYAGMEPYQGIYIQAKEQASPFESWLAELLDLTARLERERGYMNPVSFTNWVTTDPLTHPGEPTYEEDMVSVDATHLTAVGWEAGHFASFHAYPYYPDLFRFDEGLREVVNEDGELDPYQTYLRRLKEYHADMPVVISEFGLPTSWGIGHKELLGRHQGGHSEKEQGEMLASMYRAIKTEGMSGAVVFAWQDEWFKRTWNTMLFEEPQDHRAYWLNWLSNEQMFGIVGMYSSKDGVLKIDGRDDDWGSLDELDKTQLIGDGDAVRELWAAHDEAFVYLLVKLYEPFDPDRETIYIGTDSLPGGNKHAEELGEHTLDEGLETVIVLDREEQGEIKIASNYDFHTRLYGYGYKMLPVDEEEMKDDSGIFKPWMLTIGLTMQKPYTKIDHPFEDVPAGILHRGTTDPSDERYNSLASWQADGTTVEIRIPWALLGYSDPGSSQAISYELTGEKSFTSETSEGIRFVPWIAREGADGEIIGLADSEQPYPVSALPQYSWEPWEEAVTYTERPKQSYHILKQAFTEGRDKS